MCNEPHSIIAWNPLMWSADLKQKFLPKNPFGRVKYKLDNPAKNSSHEVRKLLSGVRENQRTVYFQIFFFLEIILRICRLPFWQLCWELLGKCLKLSLPKSKTDPNYVFNAKSSPPKISSKHFPAEILRFFPWNPKVLNSFSRKHFFGELLVWRGRMPLWWWLRHFSPESRKSSARIHKLMEKNDFNSIFFLWKDRLDT